MKTLVVSTVLAGLVVLGGQTNASIIFDFQDLTDTSNGEISGEWADGSDFALANSGERAFNEFDWEQSGITLTASASYHGTDTYGDSYSTAYSAGETLTAWAYLDENNAGLGVCSKGLDNDGKGSNQCNPGNDDNVTVDEWLQITFGQSVVIDFSQSIFRDGSHNDYLPEHPFIEISLDYGANWAMLDVGSTIASDNFYFRTQSDSEQFYIDALTVIVHEPNAVVLLGLGLLGLAVTRRQPVYCKIHS